MIIETDTAEEIRRARLVEVNTDPVDRATLEQRHGRAWNSIELARDFEVIGFLAPYTVVRRRADGVLGSLEFQHHPRLYFNWREDDGETPDRDQA